MHTCLYIETVHIVPSVAIIYNIKNVKLDFIHLTSYTLYIYELKFSLLIFPEKSTVLWWTSVPTGDGHSAPLPCAVSRHYPSPLSLCPHTLPAMLLVVARPCVWRTVDWLWMR